MNNFTEKLLEELNNQQKKAAGAPINSCTKIVAGAGTGKTKIISKRFTKLTFDLMEEKVENPSSRILVITFTDKAAGEMKARIMKELSENNLNSYETDFWISTFHGFCNKILRKHSIEVGLSPDFTLADDNAIEEVKEIILQALRYGEYSDLANLEEISEELKIDKNLLSIENLKKLMAIASIEEVFANIFSVISKIKALGLTPKEFLNQTIVATKNFSQTTQTIPFGFKDATEYVIAWENHLKPYMDSFCKFEEKEAFAPLTKGVVLSKNGSKKACDWTAAESFAENISEFTEVELCLTKITALIYALYQKELESRNIVDFDDLINKTIEILKNNDSIRSHYQKFFRHLIIDEFQDTNGSQLELIKLLLPDNAPNITFVGDRKQSIYGFRYAQTENLEELHKFVEQKYGQKYPEIKLETNYRSTPQVLDAVNHVTVNSLNLDEKLSAGAKLDVDKENKYVVTTEINGAENIAHYREIEAKYIASEIQRLRKEENAKYSEFAVLVKSHVQTELIEKILLEYGIPAIKKTNTSYFEHPATKSAICALQLVQNPQNEIALVRLLNIHFSDKELFMLRKNIDEEFYKNIKNEEEKRYNFAEKIIYLYEQKLLKEGILKNIFETVQKISKIKQNLSLLSIFYNIEENIQLFKEGQTFEAFKSEQNIRIFEKIIADFEYGKSYVTIKNFIEYYEKISNDRNFELPAVNTEEVDAVKLFTIHASKGLEFPYTFVAGLTSSAPSCDDKIIFDLQYGKKPGFGLIIDNLHGEPSAKKLLYKELWRKPRDINEQIRLFYVAVSRAEKYLNILTFAPLTRVKPASYTIDFPDFVTKKTVADADISVEKQALEFKFVTSKKQPMKSQNAVQTVEKHNYKFSFSRLNLFKRCKNKFILKYKFKFPILDEREETYNIGSILHKLIYSSYVYKKTFSEETIKDLIASYNLEEQDAKIIVKMYRTFELSEFSPLSLNKNYEAEKNIHFDLKLGEKNAEFTGDIDLLIENEDSTFTIIDFKTHANLEKVKEEYLKQLLIYKQAIEKTGKNVKSALLVNIKADEPVKTFQLENEKLLEEQIKSDVTEAINYFENQNELEAITNDECRYCEYGYICK